MSRYPWRNTSEDISSQTPSQWETPGGAQKKADQAEQNAKTYTDQQMGAHVGKGGAAHALAVPNGLAGFMTGEDKAKLDGVQAGANNYVHPTTHPPSIIAQDANNRFVSDTEKATWNSKATTDEATQAVKGLMSAADKTKLDGVQTGAEVNQNAFSTLNTIAAATKTDKVTFVGGTGITITTDASKKEIKVTATGNATPGPHAETHLPGGTDVIPFATSTTGGLMSDQDKKDLSSTMTQLGQTTSNLNAHIGDTTKHITAAERTSWNAKETPAGAQDKAYAAETNAKNHANVVAGQAEANANSYSNTIVGSLSQLQTANKGNVVLAINETFLSGVNAKNGVVGAINAKGVPASTNDDWNTLVTKIGLIQTERGTTNLAPNFWTACWGQEKITQGRIYFEDGKILTAYTNHYSVENGEYGLREVNYNGTLLAKRVFGRGDSVSGFVLDRGAICNRNTIAVMKDRQEILIYDHLGNLFASVMYDYSSISDVIIARGMAYIYDVGKGLLFDNNKTTIASLSTNTDYQSHSAYFVDENTFAVDTGHRTGTIRWNGTSWNTDVAEKNLAAMGMYMAALAAR
ncbi:hypothetical protein M3661_28920 [Paenibacillus sp. MER 180]|uniref:hypothetical protein n=1 Tax=Paenibacillus sp. MER 180 TaxID=2939570 RepID=UPI0020416F43|nr:hypothetical protein [Paenibacillus sp. MER 180]MCM3294123.1 hypothetical protein [Paenibacillus sp. MER 180]